MSTEYSHELVIGYMIRGIPGGFRRVIPEKSHLERQFNSKTGRRMRDVRVVDSEGYEVLILDGKEYDSDEGFLKAVAVKVGGVCVMFGDLTADHPRYAIGPWYKGNNKVSFERVVKSQGAMDKIAIKLRKLGFELGEPVVASMVVIC